MQMIASVKYIQVGIGKYSRSVTAVPPLTSLARVPHHRGVSSFAVNKVVAHFRRLHRYKTVRAGQPPA